MLLAEADDSALVVLARDGDPQAFAAILRRHGAALRRCAFRYVSHPSDVDDVVQEAAVRAWRSLDALREPSKVRAWLLQIVAREALTSTTRRPLHRELTDDSIEVAGPDAGVDRFDLHDGLRKALRSLPEEQAAAWVLREMDGLSYREIAEALDARESSVRGWLVLARRQIQRAIAERCPGAGARAVTVLLPVDPASPPIARAPSAVPATSAGPRAVPAREADAERQEGMRA